MFGMHNAGDLDQQVLAHIFPALDQLTTPATSAFPDKQ